MVSLVFKNKIAFQKIICKGCYWNVHNIPINGGFLTVLNKYIYFAVQWMRRLSTRTIMPKRTIVLRCACMFVVFPFFNTTIFEQIKHWLVHVHLLTPFILFEAKIFPYWGCIWRLDTNSVISSFIAFARFSLISLTCSTVCMSVGGRGGQTHGLSSLIWTGWPCIISLWHCVANRSGSDWKGSAVNVARGFGCELFSATAIK